MKQPQKESYTTMVEVYNRLSNKQQERSVGIMLGMLLMADEKRAAQNATGRKT